MVDVNAPGIKEFFKGRDIFITGGSGKYHHFPQTHERKSDEMLKKNIF